MELLSDSEIDSRLAELEGWERDGETIVKTFELADFVGSVEFVGKLVEPAEEMGHHPDLTVSWNKVGVSITTHAAGGLTANDFELAKRIDALAGLTAARGRPPLRSAPDAHPPRSRNAAEPGQDGAGDRGAARALSRLARVDRPHRASTTTG